MGKYHTERTKLNKLRKVQTRAHKLARAAERRSEPSKRKPGRNPRVQEQSRQEAAQRVRAKQLTRQRRKGFKTTKGIPNPTEAGDRQFGPKAKSHHLHQRNNRLARALTPEEFQKMAQDRKAGKDARKQDKKIRAA